MQYTNYFDLFFVFKQYQTSSILMSIFTIYAQFNRQILCLSSAFDVYSYTWNMTNNVHMSAIMHSYVLQIYNVHVSAIMHSYVLHKL